MAIAFVSDLHLDAYRPFSTIVHSYLNSRLYEQLLVMERVCQTLQEIQPTAIVFLGDFFNTMTESISKLVYHFGSEIIFNLKEIAPLYILVGNHDIYRDLDVFGPLVKTPGIGIIDSTVLGKIDGHSLLMVPWGGRVPDSGEILAGHLDIVGAKLNPAVTSEVGYSPQDFMGYDKVILGHYHLRQVIAGNINYIGAVMNHTLSDSDPERGIGILEEDGTLYYINIPSPLFLKVDILTQEQMYTFAEKRNLDNYYKVVIKNRDIVPLRLDYKVDYIFDIEETPNIRLDFQPSDSIEDLFMKFIEQSNTVLDKQTAMDYLREVIHDNTGK